MKRPGSLVLVVDFGGGTLDLSLVRTVAATNGQKALRAEVLAKSDAYVGGVDIDSWIVEHCLQQVGSSRSAVKEIGWQNKSIGAGRAVKNQALTPEATDTKFL